MAKRQMKKNSEGKRTMTKQPAEIFGHHWSSSTPNAINCRASHFCPFTGVKCNKQTRQVNYPMGVCSINYQNEILALCPNRFLQDNIIFEDIANKYFGSTDNQVVLHEVRLEDFGSFDHVIVKHEPMSTKIIDFVIVEVQGYQTTGTGGLVSGLKDAMVTPPNVKNTYNFGLNEYDMVKRTLIQMLHKGKVIEAWNQKIFWVMQEPLYDEFVRRYNISSLDYSDDDSTKFAIYDLNPTDGTYELALKYYKSSTLDNLFNAFRHNFDVPDKEEFMIKLKEKLASNLQSRLDLR